MNINELLWLHEVLPLLYNSLQSLKRLSKSVQISQSSNRYTAVSPAPLPQPRPAHLAAAYKRRRNKLQPESKSNRKIWVNEKNLNRDADGLFATTFERLYLHNHEEFRTRTGMAPQVFNMLFWLVGDQLNKNSIRTPIAPECRLFLTLIFLANAERILDLSKSFKMGPSTVRAIVQETCHVLWITLAPAFLPQPNTHDWKDIADGYEQSWQMPHCLGAVDAKLLHIAYKGERDIVLLASCDSTLTFTNIDIAPVLDFSSKLFLHELGDLLPAKPLNEASGDNLPYTFIADASFPMRGNLITTYEGNKLDNEQLRFNQQLTRTLDGSIGKAFDVLIDRWRVLTQPMSMNPINAEKIVKATVVLHNFVKQHDESYCPASYLNEVPPCTANTKVPSSWLHSALTTCSQTDKPNVEPVSRKSMSWRLRDRLKQQMTCIQVEPSTFEELVNSVVWAD